MTTATVQPVPMHMQYKPPVISNYPVQSVHAQADKLKPTNKLDLTSSFLPSSIFG